MKVQQRRRFEAIAEGLNPARAHEDGTQTGDHQLAGRRLSDRFRDRLRISSWCLTITDSATMARAPPAPASRATVVGRCRKRTARSRTRKILATLRNRKIAQGLRNSLCPADHRSINGHDGVELSGADAVRQKRPDVLYWLWGTVTTVALCELLPDWSVHVTVIV